MGMAAAGPQQFREDGACPESAVFLLAQLIAPPLQPGPVRLPERQLSPEQHPTEAAPGPSLNPDPGLLTPPSAAPGQPANTGTPPQSWRPSVRGTTPYSTSELAKILQPCGQATPQETLQACASALTARLENSLVGIRAIPGVGQISGNLGRLGSDPTQAVLNLTVDSVPVPWRGELAVRNDGNAGTGQWRNTATVIKNNLIRRQDTLLTYLELDADSEPELGGVIGSISYSWPFSDRWQLTGSLGYSRRNLVEATGIAHALSFRQFQALAQLEGSLYRSSHQQWSAFLGVSGNRNDSYLAGDSFPLILGGGADGWLNSGYLRAGINGAARYGNLSLGGNLYGLQGLAGLSTPAQLAELAGYGIRPGEARALGALINATWGIQPNLSLNLRAAGQVALAKLTNDMGFSIGSDVGLRGLPGSLISGDNGTLGTGELVWTVWRSHNQALQLVPFVGIGWVKTNLNGLSLNDSIGSGGLLSRWLAGRHWAMELGWVNQFSDGNNAGLWNQWLLGSGVYSKVQFRF